MHRTHARASRALSHAVTLALATTCLPAAVAYAADAAGALDEIVVTAQKREQTLQEVPISILVTTGDTLKRMQIERLEDLTPRLPNVSVTPGPAADQLYIRGVGSGINGGFEQSVGTFVDGIYHGRSRYSRGTLVDIDRVEVLRGPQSIFFGNNAIGGAFNVTTRRPGDTWEGYVKASYEFEGEEAIVTAAAGGPLGERFGVRLAAQYSDMKGYMENVIDGRKNPSPEDKFGRVYFTWKPTDSLDLGLKAEKGRMVSEAGLPLQITNCPPSAPFTVPGRVCANTLTFPQIEYEFNTKRSAGPGEEVTVDADEVMLNASLSFGDGYSFVTTAGYTGYDYYLGGDTDFSPNNVISFAVPEQFNQRSVELRLTSPSRRTIEWIAGAYYQNSNLSYRTNVTQFFLTPTINATPALAPLRPYTPIGNNVVLLQDEETKSAFGALTYFFTDSLRATAGLRWTTVDKDARHLAWIQQVQDLFGQVGTRLPAAVEPLAIPLTGTTPHDVRASRTDDDVIPSLTVQYDIRPDFMLYGSYSEGFKSGGFDALELTGRVERLSFLPESVQAFELGFKASWDSLYLNVAAFHNEYEDLQQSVAQVGATAVTFFSVSNVGGLRAQGLEADLVWKISDQLRLSFSGALLDAEYLDYPNGGCTAAQQLVTPPGRTCIQNLTGQAPPFAPNYSGYVTLDWKRPLTNSLNVFAVATATFKDAYDIVSDNEPVVRQDAWQKLDLRIGVGSADERWEVAVLGKNVTDELTAAFGQDTVGPGSHWRLLERPRQISIQGLYNF
jgi:outer membrane receptor protein involved in Fe transport